MTTALPERSKRVAAVLAAAGVRGRVHQLADSTRTAAEAAAALGCAVGAIANSLIFISDDEPVLVLTSGAHRVDPEALAERWGRGELTRATPEQVRAATGQVIGGVAPVGHPRPLPTAIDATLAGHQRIWAAAGTPRTVFPTTAEELRELTGAAVLDVTSALPGQPERP